MIIARPGKGITIDYTIGYPYEAIRKQRHIHHVGNGNHEKIAEARTINFPRLFGVHSPFFVSLNRRDLAGKLYYFWEFGYGHGATRDNVLFVGNKDDPSFINEPKFENEAVIHKIGDLMSTVKTLQKPLRDIHITVVKSGHKKELEFAKLLNKHLVKWQP